MQLCSNIALKSCRLEVATAENNCIGGYADMQLRSDISFRSGGYTVAEVLPSSCGIAIAEINKKAAHVHLCSAL
jgi:hypothetical protein